MAYWWVNHKQTRDHEVRGSYLWAPKTNSDGRRNHSYDNLTLVRIGDIVFSYANGFIGAIGRVMQPASPSPKPIEFGHVGGYWANEGWLVDVEFMEVGRPIRPRDYLASIGPLLPQRHSPIQGNGNGNQGIYLAAISDALGLVLMALLHAPQVREFDRPLEYLPERSPSATILDDIHTIESDQSLPDTQRVQLAKARIGQGVFRKRVLLVEGACRVTGVTDPRLLVASHIKPWRIATNAERIDGCNGILLSPHVDALFDDHLITFDDDGRMHVHPSLNPEVLERWAIDSGRNIGRFRDEQRKFLAHHRETFASRLG